MKHLLRLTFVLAVVLSLGSCKKLPDVREAANAFFLKIGSSQFQEAYEGTTFAFRAKTNFKSFQATARDLGLAETVSCHWQKVENDDRDVKLTGEVMSANGTTIPIIVVMAEEDRAWRIYSLLTPGRPGEKEKDQFSLVGKGDAFNSLANRDIPSAWMIRRLTRDSLEMFSDAIQRQNFTHFYSKVSTAWRNQLTIGQLARAFQPFIDAKVDIREIQHLDPIFDKPAEVNSEGILVLQGHYDTKPYKTTFRLRFTYEFPYWRLFGVEVQLEN